MDDPDSDSLPRPSQISSRRFSEPFLVFLRLGMTSFGGPVAHLGFFQREIVQRLRWVSEATYADLVALCQFLPGPASSQVGFALGYLRGGLPGALGAWLGFTLPSALIMIGCAYSLIWLQPDAGWLHGLKIAAVAVVAQAVWTMATRLCPDRSRITLALLSAAVVLIGASATAQVLVIAAGLGVGWAWLRAGNQPAGPPPPAEHASLHGPRLATLCLVVFAVLLIGLPLLAAVTRSDGLQLFSGFYRVGSLVFGGGHVVLPLLEVETVARGWLSKDAFLAGYGAAQAVPGPLFTLAAYLGAVIFPDGPGWLAGLLCLVAILVPSMLLVLGTLPFWQRLRSLSGAQGALAGANAAVVGILLAAFYDPVFTSAVTSAPSFILALLGFGALQFWRLPPWLLVGACACLGAVFL